MPLINGQRRIGVFDSGIGGLTVLHELNALFPNDNFVYIGDTARLPYGTKSRETVIKYSESLTQKILDFDVDAVVIACNTASTHALEAVLAKVGPIPAIGMIEPAAIAAAAATKNNRIAVIATSGTIHSGAYSIALKNLAPHIQVNPASCQMLVALAEEGWTHYSDEITRRILLRYLDPLFDQTQPPDTLILGCTHFPVFSKIITDILGDGVTLINSGAAAAQVLYSRLGPSPYQGPALSFASRMNFFATDDTARFARNAIRFFDQQLDPSQVSLIDVSYSAASDESARQAISRRQNPSGQSSESTAA
ncbi:MAG: glutamate racemase [Pseudobdellovibrionaceae bacterium]|nr:glutamate racemase [Pseudobdellovibrionaceae bacterium]